VPKSLVLPSFQEPAIADVPGHHSPPFGVRLVCLHIRQAFGFTRHLTSNRRPVAEGLVSSLSYSSARFQASVGFAGCAQVLGLVIHRASVAKRLLTFYGDSISEVDIWN